MAGLALACWLTSLAACGVGDPTGNRPGGNGGVSDGDGPAELLAGTWRNVSVVEVPGDLQTWTTTWVFDEDGACLQTVETESLAEGFPRITERSCTFVAGDFEVTVSFIGGGTLEIEYRFDDFLPDRLILDGFQYDRIG